MIPSVANCGAISRRLTPAPEAIVTLAGVFAGVVLGSKVNELILKFCSRVVDTAAPPVTLSAMKNTSVPAPGSEVAVPEPSLLSAQLSVDSFHWVLGVPVTSPVQYMEPVIRVPVVMEMALSVAASVMEVKPPGVAPRTQSVALKTPLVRPPSTDCKRV